MFEDDFPHPIQRYRTTPAREPFLITEQTAKPALFFSYFTSVFKIFPQYGSTKSKSYDFRHHFFPLTQKAGQEGTGDPLRSCAAARLLLQFGKLVSFVILDARQELYVQIGDSRNDTSKIVELSELYWGGTHLDAV